MFKIFTNLVIAILVICICGCANVSNVQQKASTVSASTSTSSSQSYVEPTFVIEAATLTAYESALELMRARKYENAIVEMKNVAVMDERIAGPWINIGLAYKELGDMQNAQFSFEKAISINSKNPYAYNYLAIMSREGGNFEKAEQLYKKALSVHPDYQNAHLNLGILCDQYLRKIECAIEHYQKYLNLKGGEDKQVSIWMMQLKQQGS